ncbi:hydroxymethylbilane synthase [Streptomyces sp. SBT349]|uniref:hydroxymethylbilane synthase n=1 Tax=Streptomyces sp. SBT349 TaxID=1580539 RepID=UPI0007C87041|nr:hydroxymethylbilane synthase [Streptomyces sp. SBT349]
MSEVSGRKLRVGTRSSPMALAQVEEVAGLMRAHDPGLRLDVVPVTTEADRWHGNLATMGGKGLFTAGIDAMVRRGEVDLAVHCLKDVPGDVPLPEGLVLASFPRRGDARDVLVLPEADRRRKLADLPPGAVVGTSSVRRAAQVLRARPDLRVARVRGLVGTRIDRLDHGEDSTRPDALILAASGLDRIGLSHRVRQFFAPDELLPPVGAGILGLVCRADDDAVLSLLARVDHQRTAREAAAERALLQGLRGHCNSPIAGHCSTGPGGRLTLRAMVFSPDGSRLVEARGEDAATEAAALGVRVCDELLRAGAREIIEAIAH